MTLNEGAAYTGRLIQNGNPVANAKMWLDNFGAESGSSAWTCAAFTDEHGRFLFTNLPPNRHFSLCATMESLADRGALSKQRGQVLGVGSTNDAGDIALQPPFRVAGQIRLSDGKPLPAHSHLTLRRTTMVGRQDGLTSDLGADGIFSFKGVPAEKVTIYLRVPGYELTPRDRLLKSGSATNLFVSANVMGLDITMQPESKR